MISADKVDASALERDGWTRRNVACEPRLSEAVQLYEEMGLTVRTVPLLSLTGLEEDAACTSCFEGDAEPDRFRVIFTRPAPPMNEEG